MQSLQALEFLAAYNNTDKLEHGYLPVYSKYLPESPKKLLEIGVWKGASVKMWKALYPECEIHVIDNWGHEDCISIEELEFFNIKVHVGSQDDIEFLNTIKDQFDVIIEDGSHIMKHQQVSLKHLFRHNLNTSGVWFSEDLHTSVDPDKTWHYGVTEDCDTTLHALKRLEAGIHCQTIFISSDDSDYLQEHSDIVEVVNDKICVIVKK